ncbi:MAG: hypothetical protein R3A44_00410 [Caldilineaceae bacterium]
MQIGLVRFSGEGRPPPGADGWLPARRTAAHTHGLLETLRAELDAALGPEAVLHASDAGLLFLAPADRQLGRRAEQLRWRFFSQTGSTDARVSADVISLRELCEDFCRDCVGQL